MQGNRVGPLARETWLSWPSADAFEARSLAGAGSVPFIRARTLERRARRGQVCQRSVPCLDARALEQEGVKEVCYLTLAVSLPTCPRPEKGGLEGSGLLCCLVCSDFHYTLKSYLAPTTYTHWDQPKLTDLN